MAKSVSLAVEAGDEAELRSSWSVLGPPSSIPDELPFPCYLRFVDIFAGQSDGRWRGKLWFYMEFHTKYPPMLPKAVILYE